MIHYTFCFDANNRIEFELDEDRNAGGEPDPADPPDWMLLENQRCPHCEVEPGSRLTCPAALAIQPVIKAFAGRVSHETIQVEVLHDDVLMKAQCPTQNAVRSVLGLLLALSACPIMEYFRPMAHFHLPFGDREHTVFRALGMFLVAQYLRVSEGLEPDWELAGLWKLYEDVHELNACLARRIRLATEKDAAANSLIILDALGHGVQMTVEQKVEKMKPLFEKFLK